LSNVAGVVTSSNAALTIIPSAPVITSQPTNQTVLPGAPATFNVAAIGSAPFVYQWQYNGTNLANGANISGATSSAMILRSVSPADVGAYSVVITNSLGSASSTAAVLAITPVTAPGVLLTTL